MRALRKLRRKRRRRNGRSFPSPEKFRGKAVCAGDGGDRSRSAGKRISSTQGESMRRLVQASLVAPSCHSKCHPKANAFVLPGLPNLLNHY